MAVSWICAGGCGKEEMRPPSKALKLRCAPCDYKSRAGAGNSNYRSLPQKACKLCGAAYESYQSSRSYCSAACYNKARQPEFKSPTRRCPRPREIKLTRPCPKPPKSSALIQSVCKHCGSVFVHYRSQTRSFCSYSCHVASGGARKAGMAAAEVIMRKYGAKKDANHGDVVKGLGAIGVSVIDTSHMGMGFPDLILGFRNQTILMEIKNPKTSYGRRGLNKNQQEWKAQWLGGAYCVVDGVEAAIRAVMAATSGSTVATVTDVEGALRVVNAMRYVEQVEVRAA